MAVAIDLIDATEPNPDLEDDDPAGQCDEDGINTSLHIQWAVGPGCEISDPDVEHDGREEEAGI